MDVSYFEKDAKGLNELAAQIFSRWITHRLLANLGRSLGTDKCFDICICFCGKTLSQAEALLDSFKASKSYALYESTTIRFSAVTTEELTGLFEKTNSTQTRTLANLKNAFRSRLIKNVAKASLDDQSFPVIWEALDDWVCSTVTKRDSGVSDRELIAQPLRQAFAMELQAQNIIVVDRFIGQAMGSRFLTTDQARLVLNAVNYSKASSLMA